MLDSLASKGEIRRRQIMQWIKQEGKLTLAEIVQKFDCSEATARRDLETLERRGDIIRTIGGALYEGLSQVREVSFSEKRKQLWLEKEAIARKAVTLMEEGDTVCLSGGTTTYLIARELKVRQRGVHVVTNAVNIAMELADCEDIQVVVIGGGMRAQKFELCGPLAGETIAPINIGTMYLGIDGFTIDQGITTFSEQEAETARMLMGRARETIAVFDHSKIGKASLFSIAPLERLAGCVTDRVPPPEIERHLQQLGVRLHVADDVGHE